MDLLSIYKKEAEAELFSILDYWIKHTIDEKNGGFAGKIDNNNNKDYNAPKGSVLNARILWAFAAAFNQYQNKSYLDIATRAFKYIIRHFIDNAFGGVFWTVDAKGKIFDPKKQIYALAFCIYSLSEYYQASKNITALNTAIQLYNVIEEHSFDIANKGYIEAFTRDWKTPIDLRLSTKDANEKKTMNTHLHIVEAYTNLYKIHPSTQLKNKITELLTLFDTYFINQQTYHARLFFDENWNEKPDVISYGHDIEAAWLLQQCAEMIDDKNYISIFRNYAIKMADAAAQGLDYDGGLWYEYEPSDRALIKEKHWWPQAEAMVGFMNAYQITKDKKYLKLSTGSWQFIKKYIINKEKGEWFWGIKNDYSIMQNEDKVGLWKCPYHNSRACLEIIKRLPGNKKYK